MNPTKGNTMTDRYTLAEGELCASCEPDTLAVVREKRGNAIYGFCADHAEDAPFNPNA